MPTAPSGITPSRRKNSSLRNSTILCFNAGSSSLRIAAFRAGAHDLQTLRERTIVAPEHWRENVGKLRPDIVVHRIVLCERRAAAVEECTPEVEARIAARSDLAPTHDRSALQLVAQARQAFPRARQLVAYDSAFHATIPTPRTIYAIPREWRDRFGIERIGYHGFSYAYASEWLKEHGNPRRAVCAHLGNGCSAAALRDGHSVATTMGFTPLDGLVMGTRSGSIDPGALIYLMKNGITPETLRSGLYNESGLKALCGDSDMRRVLERAKRGDADAQLGVDVFVESVVAGIAAMIAAAGGVDALTFSGGIGFGSGEMRERICQRLAWAGVGSEVLVHAIDVQEERMMALAAARL
jgi:acetate kinase